MKEKKEKVFIVALNGAALGSSLMMLQKYNLEIFVLDSISEAILSMFQLQPVCILVSSECAAEDSFSMEVLQLQAEFPVIGYTEKSLVSSVVKMSNFKFQYKIQPPISGAAIYRIIRKVMAENRSSAA